MKKVFKWIGIVLGALIGLLLVAGVVLYFVGSSRVNKVYEIPDSGIVAPTDAQSIERGKHIVESSCVGCHGADLGGVEAFINIDGIASADSANLTSGEGGLGDERESDAFTIAETMDYRPGRPLAGRGLKIITVRPVYSLATLAVRSPRVALVRIVFGREGKVLRASFVDGRDAGHRDFNEPLMDAVHRWRAEGSQLLKLPQDRPNAGLAVTIRFEMF